MKNHDFTPNTVHAIHEVGGVIVEEKTIMFDPYKDLLKDDGFASVSCTVGKGLGYGEEKVSFTVHVKCDQNEAAIDEAGKRAFAKALEFCGDAVTLLGWGKK